MKAIHSSFARTAGLVAGTLLALSAYAESKSNSDAFPIFDENYIKVSGQMPSLSGSKAAFQARTQKAESGSGGIEDMNITKELAKNTDFKFDGHILPGAEDYLAQFKIAKTDVGSVEMGYKQFRTFYDGAGGFFPINNAYLPIYTRNLYVDRAKFFATATIALPEMPVFTFRYTNETRTGRKDSTIWGDTDQTGIPVYSSSALNPISANRKIVPAYLNLDERNEQLELTVKHTIGNTTASLSFIGNRMLNEDRRSIDRYPGEVKPYPAIPSTPATLVPPSLANNQNKGFDLQRTKENGFTVMARVETKVSEKVKVYADALRRTSGNDISAARLVSAKTPTVRGVEDTVGAFTSGGRPPYSYTSSGHINQDIYTGVIGVETKPLIDLGLNFALRAEQYDASGYNQTSYVNYLIVPTTGTVTAVPVNTINGSRISDTPLSPEVNVRYTGIRTVALYADWDYRTSPGEERQSYVGISPSGNVIIPSAARANNDSKEKHNNVKIGANWTPNLMFNGRVEFFTKDHEDSFNGFGENIGEYYTLNYNIYGGRITATVKATPELSFTTRFVEQIGKAKTWGDAFAETNSGDSKRYQFGETVDWVPNKAVYVQGNVNLVFDTIITAYPLVTGNAKNVIHNADNNYWNGSLITGFVLDKNTDLQVQGTFYNADNYNPALAGSTIPYGMSARDYTLTVGVKRKLSDRAVLNAKVGYIDSTSETSGGFADYRGPIGYVSMDYKL